jgi:ABC-type Na+ efflux pump permease subunit
MMKSFSIAVKDMRLLIGDRGTLIYLFLLPFVFIFVFSGALAGFAGEDEDQAIPLPVVNLDPDGAAAAALLAEIEAAGGLRVELLAEDEAEQMMADEEIDRVLWIPAGFSSDIAAGREATLRLVNQNNADSAATEGARLVIAGAAQDLALETQLVASLEQFGAMQGPTEDAQSISTETMIAQAQDQIARAEERPLINVTQQLPEQEG